LLIFNWLETHASGLVEITPILLNFLDEIINNHESIEDLYFGHLHALYLLAKFREKEAYSREAALEKFLSHKHYGFIDDDVISGMKYWACFTERLEKRVASDLEYHKPEKTSSYNFTHVLPYTRTSPKIGDDEIVFADELGMWMLPIDKKPCISAYFKSAAAILNPDEYANAVLPVIREDSYSSFCNKAYEKAKRAANKEQKTALDKMIDHHQIRTGQNNKR
jgi:hypothetical protein